MVYEGWWTSEPEKVRISGKISSEKHCRIRKNQKCNLLRYMREKTFSGKNALNQKNNCEKVLSLYGKMNMRFRPVYEGINFWFPGGIYTLSIFFSSFNPYGYWIFCRCKCVRYMREIKVHMCKNAESRKKYWPETLIK